MKPMTWASKRFIFSVILFLAVMYLFFTQTLPKAWSHPIDMGAIKQIESSGDQYAYNAKSQAKGLYQITPVCLKHFVQFHENRTLLAALNSDVWHANRYKGEELFDPQFNRFVADWYMNWLFDRCLTVEDTLVAFNWGIGNWKKWDGRIASLPKETQNYLKKYAELAEKV